MGGPQQFDWEFIAEGQRARPAPGGRLTARAVTSVYRSWRWADRRPGEAWFTVARMQSCIDIKSKLTGLLSPTNCSSKRSCHVGERACLCYVHVCVKVRAWESQCTSLRRVLDQTAPIRKPYPYFSMFLGYIKWFKKTCIVSQPCYVLCGHNSETLCLLVTNQTSQQRNKKPNTDLQMQICFLKVPAKNVFCLLFPDLCTCWV